jgi:hypothetical protein
MKKIFTLATPVSYGASTVSFNTADIRMVYTFVAPVSGSFTDWEAPYEARTGTVTNIAQSDLYLLDANGLPTGASLATDAAFTPGNATNAVSTWDSAYDVTAGVAYGVVTKNNDGTPGANYFVMRQGLFRQTTKNSFYSVNGGTTWNNGQPGPPVNVKIGGVWYGSLCGRYVSNTMTSNVLYNSASRIARVGAVITPTENVLLEYIQCPIYRVGTLTGLNVSAEVWDGTTLLATSISQYPVETLTTSTVAAIASFKFNQLAIASGSAYRYVVRMSGTGAQGDASNYVAMKGHGPATNVPSAANVDDQYISGTWTTDPSAPSWTDYATSSGPLPGISLMCSPVAATGGGLLVGPSVLVS